MEQIERYGPVAGRVLLALIFVFSGFGKIPGWEGTAGYMASKGLPMVSLLLTLTIAVEVLGGLAIMVGWFARPAALALIGFTVLASLIFHNFWAVDEAARQIQMIMFMKNLSIIGGLLLVAAMGPGPVSVAARKLQTA